MGGITEKEVMAEIKICLDSWSVSGDVIWWERLQSLKIRHQGYWIKGCKSGTPDFIAIIRNCEDNISVLFIEAKSDTGQLRPEQKLFASKNTVKDVYCITARCRKDVSDILLSITKEFKI